jgi:hypothetical protein
VVKIHGKEFFMSYIPHKDALYDGFSINTKTYVENKTTGTHPAWEHIPADAVTGLSDAVLAFHSAYAIMAGPHTKADTEWKTKKRKESEAVLRSFVNQYLRFPPVTDEDRIKMNIPNHDTTPTNHPAPEARPAFTATANGDGKIIVKVEGTWPENAEGVKYYWEITDTPDPDPANLRHSTYKNKLKHEFVFDAPDWGKKISFACAFENGKGDSGPLSAMVSRLVP